MSKSKSIFIEVNCDFVLVTSLITGMLSMVNPDQDFIFNEVDISGVFTSGGTTSIEFLKSIGATGTNLIDEIENGVIMNKIKGVSNDLYLVTKAGAFGNKKTIYNSLNQIRRISK